MSTSSNEAVVSSYAQAPTRTIGAGGVTYAYPELGPRGGPRRLILSSGCELFTPVAVDFLGR